MSTTTPRIPPVIILLALILNCATLALAAPDDEDAPEFLPGLVAIYQAEAGAKCMRLDDTLSFVWRDRSPDPRLPAGNFSVQWQGRLFSIVPGQYQLHIYAAGAVRLKLNDQVLLDDTNQEPRWLATKPVNLTYGYHPLVVEFRKLNSQARIGLYWSGPQFQLEPIPDRHLFHEPAKKPDQSFEQGQQLARALRCSACHSIPGEQAAIKGPALTHLGTMSQDWLIDWLAASNHDAVEPPADTSSIRRMPVLGLSRDDAQAIAEYLLSVSQPLPPFKEPKSSPPPKKSTPDKAARSTAKKSPAKPKPHVPGAAAGATLFNTLGCVACHRLDGIGVAGLFGGGDLSAIAQKRPADFFNRWLSQPADSNPAHRMPVFTLSPEERADLTELLKSRGKPFETKSTTPNAANLARGQKLVVEHRCSACHALPQTATSKPSVDAPRITAASNWEKSCLASADVKLRRPGYSLSSEQKSALRTYLSATQGAADEKPGPRDVPIDGRFVLTERNCLGCHARGLSPGIAARLDIVTKAKPELAPLLPALAPPALSGVGDKLHDAALESAIALRHPPLRPWLSIRMPKFNLSEEEMRAITAHFIDADRIPDRSTSEPANVPPLEDDAPRVLAGSRLVTADGFGCTSCHQIGNSIPLKVALNAHGTDLSLLGTRIRRPWYDRWVRNPARIVPRMEMPAIQLPVRGVLHDRLDEQLAAVWHVLNQPGFDPPLPDPVRVVRARNVPGVVEPASALTDVLEIGKQVYLKPLVVGLPNRHDVLFDLESNRLAGWWLGDTARQRTRGKSWYWESGGANVLPTADGDSELQLNLQGKLHSPQPYGQFAADLDSFEHTPTGLRFAYRLQFAPVTEQAQPAILQVQQTIEPVQPAAGAQGLTGFRRKLEIDGLPAGAELRLRVLPHHDLPATRTGQTWQVTGLRGNPRVTVVLPQDPTIAITPDGPWLTLKTSRADQTLLCEFEYLVNLPVDQFPTELPVIEPPPAASLKVVPGYEAVRLPLSPREMPTGLAWREDGTLVICSLKGQVFLVRDTNGDGLPDNYSPFSDDLAAPYGVATNGKAIDVINKYGLLRLYDDTGDGRADRTEVLASGWGYSVDYHDWAVGLPRDARGNYYVALPCQQDERTPAAAHLRGQALRLVPRTPTRKEPRSFAIEPICAGLRFPMGLALNPRGDLFASDNQGNYTPFNELNHLVSGQRYGFINKLEVRPDFDPPFKEAAINIPHPWVRSVNGICFLRTPEAVRKARGHNLFGPFEGHLLGCEYNNRSLVRMSLESIGDTYQGAVYPFSIPPNAEAPATANLATAFSPELESQNFEGPVVCEVAPDGDVYVGNLRDSAWGGGQNTGSIVRMRSLPQTLPCGIAEVRAHARGFTIDFVSPVDSVQAADTKNYSVLSYRRVATPAYGGTDVDTHTAVVQSIELSSDGRRATLALDKLRAGFVYELRLTNLAPGQKEFFPAEAYYTLHKIPE
jgi:mono/diheme cytochrome c family protein